MLLVLLYYSSSWKSTIINTCVFRYDFSWHIICKFDTSRWRRVYIGCKLSKNSSWWYDFLDDKHTTYKLFAIIFFTIFFFSSKCECWTYINCIMSAVLWVGPYHRSVMESFHLELVWVMASFLPEQNIGRAASFSVYHCPVGQSLDPSSPATIKNPLKGAPLIVTV